MSSDAIERPLGPSLFGRLAEATRYAITGVRPDTWFGPQQPLAPQAPPEVKGRQFDYAFGANLNYIPRSEGGISFAELRALADALPLLRAVIETRKDQIAAQNFTVRQRSRANLTDASPRIDAALRFLARPDRRRSFGDWLRMLIEDLLVIDAATIYPRFTRAGAIYSLDVIDGATIKPLIGEDGRAPEAPDPAYQQILHGLPAADFSADELLYLPRNVRAHKLYGMSPVEQIALTVNIALRRDVATLDYYRTGSSPENAPWGFLEWSVAGLTSIGASTAAFVWRLMTRLHALEIAVRQNRHDLDEAQSGNESVLLRLAERLALLHDDHYRLRETISALPTRADIRDLELRLGERMDSLAARFDRAFDLRSS
jgi:hypothetical protein